MLQKAGWDKLSFDQKMQSGLLDLDLHHLSHEERELVRPAEPYAVPKASAPRQTRRLCVTLMRDTCCSDRAATITEGAR